MSNSHASYLDSIKTTKPAMIGIARNLLLSQPGTVNLMENRLQITTSGEIKTFGRSSYIGNIDLDLPTQIFGKDPSDETMLNAPSELWPYGEYVTLRIAMSIFHRDWDKFSLGIVPGEFGFNEKGHLYFNGKLDPEDGSSVLVYANAPMEAHSGKCGLTSFNFGKTGLHGLIVPISYLTEESKAFPNVSMLNFCKAMSRGLEKYLEGIA